MTDDELKSLFNAMRQENAAAHSETRRHFEVLTEATRQEIRLVAESVAGVNEKLDREAGDIRGEMRRGFAETRHDQVLPCGDRSPDAFARRRHR